MRKRKICKALLLQKCVLLCKRLIYKILLLVYTRRLTFSIICSKLKKIFSIQKSTLFYNLILRKSGGIIMSLFDSPLLKPFHNMGAKAGAKAAAKINQTIIGKKTDSESYLTSSDGYDEELNQILQKERTLYPEWEKVWVGKYRKEYYVENALRNFLEDPIDSRDFSIIDNIPKDLRNNDYFTGKVIEMLNEYLDLCANGYRNNEISTNTVYKYLGQLRHFPELGENFETWFKNEEYFVSNEKVSGSVLDINKSIHEQFKEILKSGLPDSFEKFFAIMSNAYNVILNNEFRGEKLTGVSANLALVNILMMSDVSINEFDELKRAILFLALDDNRDNENNDQYFALSKLAEITFGSTHSLGEQTIVCPPVDVLIAMAIRYSKNGRTDEFDEKLRTWFATSYLYELKEEQCQLLQRVFEELRVYSSEEILLESMMNWDVKHTMEQEKRLLFLKQNATMISKDTSKYTPMAVVEDNFSYKNVSENSELIYDHRFLTWNEGDIDNYFKNLTLTGKSHEIAAVVDKWSKNVVMESKFWSNSSVANMLEATIKDEFNEAYKVVSVKAGVVIDDEIDATPAVYIQPTDEARYQDIAFLVVGEPMTKKQLHLSIFVLVLPDEQDEENEKVSKRISSVKEKHNPKLETYVETTKSIIIEQVNKWVVSTTGNMDIY